MKSKCHCPRIPVAQTVFRQPFARPRTGSCGLWSLTLSELPPARANSNPLQAVAWIAALTVALQPFTLQLQGLSPYAFAPTGGRPFDFYLLTSVGVLAAGALLRKMGLAIAIIRRNALLVFFVGFCFLTAVWSEIPYLTLRTCASLLALVAIVFGAATSSGSSAVYVRWNLLALFSIILMSVVMAVVFPIYGTQHGALEYGLNRWRGVYVYKNHLGLVASVAFVLFACAPGRAFSTTLRIAGVLLSALCVIKSRSGSGIVVITIGLLLYYALFKAKRYVRYALIFLILFMTPIVLTYGQDFLSYGTGLIGKDDSFTGRTTVWDVGWKLWMEKPVLGFGLSAFSSSYVIAGFQNAATASGHLAVMDPHNAVMFLGITVGGIGVGLLLGAIAAGYWAVYSARRGGAAVLSRPFVTLILSLGLVVAGVESAPFWPGTPEFMIIVSALVGASIIGWGDEAAAVREPVGPVGERVRPISRRRRVA